MLLLRSSYLKKGVNPVVHDVERALAVAKQMVEAEAQVLQKVSTQFDTRFLRAVQIIMQRKILVTGSGTSAYIAGRFAHLAACCGLPAYFLHPCDALHGSSGAIQRGDVLVVISKGGETSEINELVKVAKFRGAQVIALTSNEKATLASLSDHVIIVDTDGADPFGLLACGSSLGNAAVTDAICAVVISEKGLDLQTFAKQHPWGAVGLRLKNQEKKE